MATDATGTPTSLGIPKFNTSNDNPSGLGTNAMMDAIDDLLVDRITKPASPTDGDLLTYDSGTGEWVAEAAPSSGSASVTPVQLATPSGGSFWTVTSLGTVAWLAPHWELPDAATTLVYGTVLVPTGVTAATLRLALAANATTGNAVVKCSVASAADGETLAPATWGILDTSNTVAMPGTAYLRKDTTFSLTGLAGGDLLPVAISRLGSDGSDSLTANLLLFGAWLEPA